MTLDASTGLPRPRRPLRGGRATVRVGPDTPTVGAGVDPVRFLTPADRATVGPVARLRLHPADRALVHPGELITSGQPVIEHCRETFLIEVPARGAIAEVLPGEAVDLGLLLAGGSIGRQHARVGDRARLQFIGPDGIARVALGRSPQIVASPVDGEVEEVQAGHISIRSGGIGLVGRIAWGQPVHGRLMLGVSAPHAELRASAIDIAAAGSILVAGARLDIEALTRARAIGVAGILCGGLVGRELRQLEESDIRQRAALHTTAPFAVVALDGYGRRVVPIHAWELLVAAAGRPVGLFPDSRLAVIGGDPAGMDPPEHERDAVRITSGEGAGRVARLVGLGRPHAPAGRQLPRVRVHRGDGRGWVTSSADRAAVRPGAARVIVAAQQRTVRLRSASTHETRSLGAALAAVARAGDRIALLGPLGAGKTQLAKGFGAGLGVIDEVTSPSFTLMAEYAGRVPLFHVDLYRLAGSEDAVASGILDEREDDGVTLVEWADRLDAALDADRLTIRIEPIADDDRLVSLEAAAGGRYAAYLDAAAGWAAAAGPSARLDALPGTGVEP